MSLFNAQQSFVELEVIFIINEDQLRIISLTAYLSKVFEQQVVGWLKLFVGDQLDWGQYGGEKGSSISHYLIDFVNYISFNQDLRIPHAVLAVLIDYSKAFNRINHNLIITILSERGVPGWLLKIVIGFLTDREMLVRYKGKYSNRKSLPGGGPQGTRLGLFLFLILINAARIGHLQEHTGSHITKSLNKRTPIQSIHLKYVDDMTGAVAINLKECLIPNPDLSPPRPLDFHDRTGHVLPAGSCKLQDEVEKLIVYCEQNEMRINEEKTKVVLFNNSKKYDFMPKLYIHENKFLEVVEQFKLLGIVFRSDLRWHANTQQMCEKGYARLWMLRRLKSLGASTSEMVDVYQKQIRCVLELAVAVWEPGLSVMEGRQLERVQKAAFSIILGEHYVDYENALETLESDLLSERRYKLCLNFAKKCLKHPKYKHWFCENDKVTTIKTRSEKTELKNVETRTKRYENSPLPYLTEILNMYIADNGK